MVEQTRIGRQIGARRPADGPLVDTSQPLDRLHPSNPSPGDYPIGRFQCVALFFVSRNVEAEMFTD